MNRIPVVVALVAVACTDQSVTQYVGEAMNEATPERSGRVRLTLFSRTDTGFSGVMEIGNPVNGTGSAYGWHEGSELRVVTVGADEADTILWASKLVGEEIGGQFEIIGGKRAGQVGTWRANLTRGPPASPATLQIPQGIPRPPLTALWPLPVIVGIGALALRWIRRAPAPPAVQTLTSDDRSGESVAHPTAGDARGAPAPADVAGLDVAIAEATITPLAGAAHNDPAAPVQRRPIQGWLAFFVVVQWVGIAVFVVSLVGVATNYRDSLGALTVLPGMQAFIVGEAFIALLRLPLALVGLRLIQTRSRFAPRFWLVALSLTAVAAVIDNFFVGVMNDQIARLIGRTYDQSEVTNIVSEQWRMVFWALVWSVYWTRSERVRATFGAAALDTVVTDRGQLVEVLSDQPAQQTQVLRRIAVGTVGAAVVLIAFVAIKSRSVSRYEVPDGTDIRDVATGRWSWTTERPSCGRSAHVIAFLDSGRVMTITTPPSLSDSAPAVTTYDIRMATTSIIRAAIRGETRLTSYGDTVVWDLVLSGHDEYRWQRTDWQSDNYTAPIIRCPATPADSIRR